MIKIANPGGLTLFGLIEKGGVSSGWPILFGLIEKGGVSSESETVFSQLTQNSKMVSRVCPIFATVSGARDKSYPRRYNRGGWPKSLISEPTEDGKTCPPTL
jgi:hypothetical protein